ncbi:hypothetical protein [Pseudoprimorskyibacter insulae]|uniref:Uncharacterized protein n=1 Tax=Pseudoprimorskyibacter insulae TaxID=1695997 RepID=A0A2R8AXC3_9RHOB|nr:hypothetical protein [Pseudoprimorskyibacter insulae]SPF80701.1 hypothetical protein PRI8871_02512 [Pseudoprimorskyibacter insulae]
MLTKSSIRAFSTTRAALLVGLVIASQVLIHGTSTGARVAEHGVAPAIYNVVDEGDCPVVALGDAIQRICARSLSPTDL